MYKVVILIVLLACSACSVSPPDMGHPKRIELQKFRECMAAGGTLHICERIKG